MLRVRADHPHHAFALDDLALVADFAYGSLYFHVNASLVIVS